MMIALDEAPDGFIESYKSKLHAAGFKLQSAPNLMIPTDLAQPRYQATNDQGTRHVFLAMRGSPLQELRDDAALYRMVDDFALKTLIGQ